MADCPTGGCAVRFTTRAEKRTEYERDPEKALEIWQGLRDDLFRMGHNYFNGTYTLGRIEVFLHDAWDEIIHAAVLHPADSAELDRLVTLIIQVRELGGLARNPDYASAQPSGEGSGGGGRVEEAVVSNGQRLWTDLPFLADDMLAFWTNESGTLTGAERASLAALTSKLCAAGVCAPGLARCALWLLTQTLEDELPSESMAEMLPACEEWFRYSKMTLVKMCRDNYCPASSSSAAGPLVANSDPAISTGGFSEARWLFWRRRLGQIYTDGSGDVARLGRACFEQMINAGLHAGVDVAGEKVYLARLFKALEAELASGRKKGCVGAEDIEIDAGWAEEGEGDK